jgi:tRNA-dihydrouridine synthase A
MMDWTDRHCRYFHRLISRRALLYTEMITSAALVKGNAHYLLDYNSSEHPLVVQLGGSDPGELAEASALCEEKGYDEINLNVGCPSNRVKAGCFGAVLMAMPDLVASCVKQMCQAVSIDVTVKCRIGIDDQDPNLSLPNFLSRISDSGASKVIIHARKAWLDGISPKQNRELPLLDYELVQRMVEKFPDLHISVNGGISTFEHVKYFFDVNFRGVMVGRSAYNDPWVILSKVDNDLFGDKCNFKSRNEVVFAMLPYIESHLADGGKLNQITRHMLGLFKGQLGAKTWRRILSNEAHLPGADHTLLLKALDCMSEHKIDRLVSEGISSSLQ